MTDLKDLIEQEIDQYLEWPTADKSHVTTVSAKLFAEHVARLYADHIPEATKKIGRRQIREAFLRNGAHIEPGRDDLPDWVYESVFELLDSAIQQAGPDIQYVAPAVQGEPVGEVRFELGAPSVIYAELYSENLPSLAPGTKLYAAPQPAEQQPAPDVTRESAMVVLERDEDGTPTVWCDPEIADLVSALNKAGIRTVASCSGHGHRPGNIMLADGRELAIARDFDEARKIDAMFPGINGEPPRVDVAGLVEALERIASLPMNSCSTENDYRLSAAKAISAGVLAAHRKQGGCK